MLKSGLESWIDLTAIDEGTRFEVYVYVIIIVEKNMGITTRYLFGNALPLSAHTRP